MVFDIPRPLGDWEVHFPFFPAFTKLFFKIFCFLIAHCPSSCQVLEFTPHLVNQSFHLTAFAYFSFLSFFCAKLYIPVYHFSSLWYLMKSLARYSQSMKVFVIRSWMKLPNCVKKLKTLKKI